MRALQRDALVAYILHQMRANPDSAHIDTPDKLFEYFLMDVQMDPCMQTSRIRHALSSVQLFIERCLMNLEKKKVAPSSIKAKQWEWMKRYRVWEANRKVFLWPENWLEPELRDNQSPFFKETMSELLQGDITEDRAAVALLNYLSKLEEVAKLEPCGIHYVENDPSKREDDVAHVVARTAGANRKYFYRVANTGIDPVEKVTDIEDNPVMPVLWRNRLFLFWLKLIQETQPEEREAPGGTSPWTSTRLRSSPQAASDDDSDPVGATSVAMAAARTSDPHGHCSWGPSISRVEGVRSVRGLAAGPVLTNDALRVVVSNQSVPARRSPVQPVQLAGAPESKKAVHFPSDVGHADHVLNVTYAAAARRTPSSTTPSPTGRSSRTTRRGDAWIRRSSTRTPATSST
jgi:hypothetical protein